MLDAHNQVPSDGESSKEFGHLLAAQIPDLYRYARYVIGNATEAEDVVGETLLRALERADQFRGDANLRTWLHQILNHLAVDRSRHQGYEIAIDDVVAKWDDENFSVDASVVLERAETLAELEEALLHLPFIYRSVLVLHDALAWSVADITSILEIGQSAVKQRLRRGRMMLVNILSKGDERRLANRGVTMSCVEARSQVSDYIDNELDAKESAELEGHLATCATCPPLYRALVGVKSSMGVLHDPNSVISPALLRRVREKSEGRT